MKARRSSSRSNRWRASTGTDRTGRPANNCCLRGVSRKVPVVVSRTSNSRK
jgi:hypothetical protein